MTRIVKQFPTTVRPGNLVNVPKKFAEAHDIRDGDLLVLEVLLHERDDETIYEVQ